jgi:hypothetical protein
MKIIGYILLAAASVLVLSYCGMALNVAMQPARIVQKTLDADNVLYNYEWFRNQYADIQTWQQRVDNKHAELNAFLASVGPRDTWKSQDRNYFASLSSQITGLNNQLIAMKATYNANASKANRSIFMAGLPEVIN